MYQVIFDIILREGQRKSDQKKVNKLKVYPFKLQSGLWSKNQTT